MRIATCLLVLGLGLLVTAGSLSTPTATTPDTTLAGRYYIRNRTRDFYRRATPTHKHSSHKIAQTSADLKLQSAEEFSEAELLAGRYYIRNRTRDFYRRATNSKSTRYRHVS